MLEQLLISASFYIPELLSILLMCFLLMGEAANKEEHGSRDKIYWVALVGLVIIAGFTICNFSKNPTTAFYNAVVIDPFSTLVKLIMVIGTIASIYLSRSSKDIYTNLKSEFAIMAVGVLIGGMLLASANNMLTLYLGIETLSILSYVMATLKRDDSASTEAGLKYVLYGGLTAGVMLFGMSHIYGQLGTIQFAEIITKLPEVQGQSMVILLGSFLMFFAGIGYKISCFPFHMWSPDVYQGSPIPVTSFFSIVPKLAGMAVLIRVSMIFFSSGNALSVSWVGLMHVIAAMTMTVGNVTAIGQNSVKRLLAFSSIGHVGMMMLGVVVLNEQGIQAILFYGIVYMFMTLAAFYITSHLSDMYGSDSQDVFRGLIYKHPLMAIVMVGVLFSLAGVPPFSGFVAKFNIFNVIIEKKYYGLAIIAGLNSVISMYYYLRLSKTIIFGQQESEEKVTGFTTVNQAIIFVMFIPVLLLGVFWENIMIISGSARIFIR